jgi:hypothetical protein
MRGSSVLSVWAMESERRRPRKRHATSGFAGLRAFLQRTV